ncbi:MAG: tyrosine-type recombinase/integrase [Alphaproteobacteria bacterium]|nr:tyrosine-type recombinase/integrase [Alphaproteobacteria bacterium]
MPGKTPANRPAPVPPREAWFAGIESGHNRKGYMRDVGEFMSFAGLAEPERLRDATPEQVEAWRDALLDRSLKPATVRRKLSALSSLFDELLALGAVAANPVRGVERPADEEGRYAAPVLTGEQARRLLDAPPEGTIKGLRDRAILAVMLCQGLTREELCGLSVDDLAVIDGQLCLRIAGNRGRMRIAALHPETEQRIGDYLSRAGHGRDPSGPLFRPVANNRGGGRLDRALDPGSIYSNVVRHHADRSGLTREVEGLCAHSLRATAAATALHDGARPEAVRDWLGHANIAATLLYYRLPASDRIDPAFRISYPKPEPVQEDVELPAFLEAALAVAEAGDRGTSGPDVPA